MRNCFSVVAAVPLSVRSAGRSTPAGPVPLQQLEPRTSTSGTEVGCSGSAADRKTETRKLEYSSDAPAGLPLQTMDGWRVYHGGDPLLSLFAVLGRFQEVLQDLVVPGQLQTNDRTENLFTELQTGTESRVGPPVGQ